ncbi:hypothetical protein [Novosphingobium sp. UBA1939]|uniref:hypothetical protein n=1 Tax=Novosphingobium sp. UBA1939 TaxID=1946982 RepID=UPI0025E115C5|nr:hypothetical protein [Novosphingobium sp. UBA1939]
MQEIQKAAQNIVIDYARGAWFDLDKEQALNLAKFVTLKTMVNEFCDPDTVHISQDVRTAFYSSEEHMPPNDFQIFIAPFDDSGEINRGFWHRALRTEAEDLRYKKAAMVIDKIAFFAQNPPPQASMFQECLVYQTLFPMKCLYPAKGLHRPLESITWSGVQRIIDGRAILPGIGELQTL